MPKSQPKWGASSGYWIPTFTLDETTRQAIAAFIKQNPQPGFYEALESATNNFIGLSEYKSKTPRFANAKAAIAELECDTRKLRDKFIKIDSLTRSIIGEAWVLDGRTGHIVSDSQEALLNMWTALLMAQGATKGKSIRYVDLKRDFVSKIHEIFTLFELKPTATEGGRFESCVSLLLKFSRNNSSRGNIHRLSLEAAKSFRLIRGKKTPPIN